MAAKAGQHFESYLKDYGLSHNRKENANFVDFRNRLYNSDGVDIDF